MKHRKRLQQRMSRRVEMRQALRTRTINGGDPQFSLHRAPRWLGIDYSADYSGPRWNSSNR